MKIQLFSNKILQTSVPYKSIQQQQQQQQQQLSLLSQASRGRLDMKPKGYSNQ
jgi:hypothetical protein